MSLSRNRISVITPSFNQGSFIEQTILSIVSQKYENLEHIIVDGGSTDQTESIVKKYSQKISHWVSEKDNGQSDAVNKGISLATGDIIGWINSDDYYNPGVFESVVKYFDSHLEVDVVFGDYFYVDVNGEFLKARKEIAADLNTYLWVGLCPHANCAGFFRKRFFNRTGKLREDLHFLMDYELYLRGLIAGMKFGHVSSFWGNYRIHGKAKTANHGGAAYFDELGELQRLYMEQLGYDPSSPMNSIRRLRSSLVRKTKKLVRGCYFPIAIPGRLRMDGSSMFA